MNSLQRAAIVAKALPSLASAAWKSIGSLSSAPLWGWGESVRFQLGGLGYSYDRLATLLFRNPYAARGFHTLTNLVTAVPLLVQQQGQGGEWEAAEGSAQSDMLRLFERPNERTTRHRFYTKMLLALYCGGGFFVERQSPQTGPNRGRVRALRLIMPDEFAGYVREQQTGEVTGYRFRNRHTGALYTRTTDEVYHVHTVHPTSDDEGLPILLANQVLTTMEKMSAWNESIAEGGGNIAGYWKPAGLEPGKQITTEQQETAQAWFDAKRRDIAQRGAEMVLSGAWERVPGQVTPKDVDWANGEEMGIRKIAALLGVMPSLVGSVKAGSLTDAGMDSEVRATYLLTGLPLLGFVLSEMSLFLLPQGFRFWYDRDQIDALSEDTNALWKRVGEAAAVHRILTRDEARQVVGYDPLTPEQAAELAPQPVAADRPEDGDRVAEARRSLTAKGLIHLISEAA